MRKYLILRILTICAAVVIGMWFGYQVKEVVVYHPTYPMYEEIDGRPTRLKIHAHDDISLIKDIIKGAEKTDDIPNRVSVFYRINIVRNIKIERYEVVLDPDSGRFFISIDLNKLKGYTITQEQFETIEEIFNR